MESRYSLQKLFVILAIAALWCGPAFARNQGSLRYSVVVDKFENNTEDKRALGHEWSTILTSKLHESGQFIVISQSDAQLKALREQMRGASGTTAQGRKTAVRSQMTPAQLFVKGSITHIKEDAGDQGGGWGLGKIKIRAGRKKTEVRATLQMIDTSTGALVASRSFVGISQERRMAIVESSGKSDVTMGEDDDVHDALERAIDEAIPWMVTQLPAVQWRGTVVKVDKERIIVNRGSREGVDVGDEFIVGESEILRDPDTGEVIDEFVTERARIKVVHVSERTAVCSVVSGKANQIVERMAIRYSKEG